MKVAVCVDDSKPSELALDKAIEFAEKFDTEVVLIHSVNPEVTYQEGDQLVKEDEIEAVSRGEDLTHTLCDRLQQETTVDVSAEVLTADSNPVSEIIDYIDDSNIVQVFIGHRALDTKHEQLFGSFAKEMISNSPVPVTVTTTNGDASA